MKGSVPRLACVLVLFIPMLLLAAGVGPVRAGDQNTLTVGFYIEPQTFDPHVATSTDVFILWNMYEGLLDLDKDGKPIPALATSYTVSSDQKAYTFKLRQGVKFHDGTPFTAAAVKTSIERILHFKRGASWLLQSVKEVQVLDDSTVRVVLSKPDVAFQTGLPFIYILSPAAVKKHEGKPGDLAPTWFIDHSAGTGPYMIERWTRGERLVMTKFADYWRGWKGPHLSKVEYLSVLEAGTQRLMVEKGDMDIPLIYTADDVEAYRKNPGVIIDVKPGAEQMYIRLHNQAGATKDKRVRQALSMAFDWKTYEVVMRGQVSPSDGPVPSELLDGWKPEGVIREYNLQKAKKLLEEAGHGKGFKMTYLYNKGDEEKRIMGEIWRAGLQKIGVELDVKIMTWPVMVERLSGWGDTRDPATAESSYGQYTNTRIPDAYAFLYFMYHSKASKGAGRNFMYYSNPKVDSLIERATSLPTEERIKLYRQAAQLIVDDAPDIFTNRIPDISIRRAVVQGFRHDPYSRRAYHFYELYKTGP